MDKEKLSKLQTSIFILSVLIMCGCFVFMGIQKTRNSKPQVTINISEENTTVEETKPVTEKISVTTKSPETKRLKPEKTEDRVTKAVDFPIDINTAEEEDLRQLAGIGEVLSAEIVRYRNENGYFNNIEEIMNVPGIGIGIFDNIKEYIYVENPVYPKESDIDELEPETEPEKTITLEEAAPIELNSADAALLMLLPYVDEIIAGEIIDLRDSLGKFIDPYELLYLDGLTQQQVDEITEYAYVEND